MLHKVFVSYHHDRDQRSANELRDFYGTNDTFIDRSLPEEIDSDDNDYILGQIRTKHLKTSTVTIALIGRDTWSRKWVDWEIYSSLRLNGDRTVNGLPGIILPDGKQWPERLKDNFKEEQRFGEWVQTGYAKVVNWADMAPPSDWRSPWAANPALISQRRQYLSAWINYAFENRPFTSLIDNSRPRMQRNRSTTPNWW
jgi:hypothetical protein